MVMALPTMRDSAVSPCFHGCPAFLHGHFPPQSPPPGPLNLSLCSQKQPSPRDCSTVPKLWLPAAVPSSILLQGMCGCGKDCRILIPFRLPQISCFPLSLKCFSSDSDNCPDVRISPLLQFPYPPRAGPVPLVFPPSSFILQSFVWFYTFFSTGQVLLAALSCCSACTSVSEGEFLMYLWSEMYPMSSSTILLSLCFLICCLGLSMLFFQGASVF